MSKIKLIHTIRSSNNEISYSDVLKTVKQIKKQVEEEGLEDELEIIIVINTDKNSISSEQQNIFDSKDFEIPFI